MKALVLAALLVVAPAGVSAQGHQRVRGLRPSAEADGQPRRQALEKQFRERSEQVVRKKLNLNDDQLSRLRAVNANIGAQRNSLMQQERAVRVDLRDEMAKGSRADQNRVAQLMNQAHELQARRFTLQQDEQRQLSGFMTPVQVAQYVGFQAQIRQRMRQMLQGEAGDQPAIP